MVNRKELTKEQVFAAINNGEFDKEVVSSKNKVVVIMTQDWCPQWHSIKSWVYGIEAEEDIDIYELVYNKTSFHQEFMNFKESKWGNYTIPYLRYYIGGKLVRSTNYVGQRELKEILELK